MFCDRFSLELCELNVKFIWKNKHVEVARKNYKKEKILKYTLTPVIRTLRSDAQRDRQYSETDREP